MKTSRTFPKLLAVIALFALVLSFASCSFFGTGSLKLESFTVDRASVKTNYLIGEEIDFTGIKATVKYSDQSLNTVYSYADLKITYPDDITATEGEKEVSVSFDDPHLNVTQETKVKIKVTAEPVVDEEDPQILVGFEKPANLTAFDSANSGAGKSQYGDAAFSGEFAVGDHTYVIGNNNPFVFVPDVAVLNDENKVDNLNAFFAEVEISIEKDGAFVALTAVKAEGNDVKFFDGETLIATVDTYNCAYQFSADAAGAKVQISVLPSEAHYIFDDVNAVVLVANIIDAYNVYEAWELALIDNDTSEDRGYKLDDHNIWDSFKAEKGIAGISVSGIVIHGDLKVTSDDVPSAFFLTTTKDVVYTNASNGSTITIPAGTKYLKDWAEIYRRTLSSGESFTIEGNLFTIDLSEFPIVASPAVFGLEGDDDDYGNDFSNATLFKFFNNNQAESEDLYAKANINNVALIGNAARNSLVDSEGALASAGGLIFIKIHSYATANLSNIIGNSFFITYFAEYDSIMRVTDVKCYDSYQNAVFVWGNSKAFFDKSYLNGAGGPVVICASPEIDSSGVFSQPNFIANDSIIETHLSGEEIWFTAVNANAIISQIKGLGMGLGQAGLGNFIDSTGKMNIQGLIMAKGSDAMAIVTGVGASGIISFNGEGMSRLPDSAVWQSIQTLYAYNPATISAPFLTVYDAAGTAYTLWSDGVNLYDMTGAMFNPDPTNGGSMEHYGIYLAFQSAKTITLTQGGLSVVFDFYH